MFIDTGEARRALISHIPRSSLKNLAQIAKTHAIAGASAGVALGIVHGVVSVHESQLRDRYDVAAEGLTHVGTGAILGMLGAVTTAFAGVSVAAVTGRRFLTLAVPLIASLAVTGTAQEPVERIVRSWSGNAVQSLRRALQRKGSPRQSVELAGDD